MRLSRPAEHRRMPWKNGGGTTAEILLEPGVDGRFAYRLSIADVASDGPFSRFDGYDRHIMLLDGAGMTLDCGAHGSITLARFEPRTFSGDWDVVGRLTSGAVRDFNLIVDRARATSSLRVARVAGHADFGGDGTCIVHVLEGALDEASAGDTIVLHDEALTVHGHATLAVGTASPI